jgi:hypothetical protein
MAFNGIVSIAEALKVILSLTFLGISRIRKAFNGVVASVKVLKVNSSLTSLNLESKNNGNEGEMCNG